VATLIDLALGLDLWANYQIGGPQWQFVEHAEVFAVSAGRWALTASLLF
jgi:NADH-quinone oxidoreductase subunit M